MAQSDDEYAAAENARRLRDAVKRGTIAAVQMNPPRCRVSFGGEHQSGWLQWFTHATSERVDWSAPSVGDPVTVVSEGEIREMASSCSDYILTTKHRPVLTLTTTSPYIVTAQR
ncbi:phage baseplate assembly protein V [Escherichia coli]